MAMTKRHMVTIKRSCSCSMPGVWGAAAHNEGAAVIFHSPRACGHVACAMDLGSHYHLMARNRLVPQQYTAPLITSNLEDTHSVFGGGDQLRQCLDHVVEWYQPRYVLIANSCVAGVIGDDTQAIAREGEEKWGIPVLPVPCSGFLDGEYYAGYYHGAKLLIEKLMKPQLVMENTVTLLGDRGGPWGADAREIQQLLHFFGLRVHCHFPGYASMEDLQRVPASSLCIPMGGGRSHPEFSMQKLAADIKERFGVPYLGHGYPVGWQGMKSWLKALGEQVHRERAAEEAIEAEYKRLLLQVENCRTAGRELRVLVCIGRPLVHFHPGWVLELLELTGARIDGIVLFSGLTIEQKTAMTEELGKISPVPVMMEEESGGAMERADLLVTTHEMEDTGKRQLFLPVLPPLGVGGMTDLMRKLIRQAGRAGRQGGVLYGW